MKPFMFVILFLLVLSACTVTELEVVENTAIIQTATHILEPTQAAQASPSATDTPNIATRAGAVPNTTPITVRPTDTPYIPLPTRAGAVPNTTPITIRPTETPYIPLPTHTPHTPTAIPEKVYLSPDGSQLAIVENLGSLIIEEVDGDSREILVTNEILALTWFPDGNHIVYSDHGISEHFMIRRFRLWIVNLESGEKHQISDSYVPGPDFVPLISPDGKYVAFLSSTYGGEACFWSYRLAVLELDEALQPIAIYHQLDFIGLPDDDQGVGFYPVVTKDLSEQFKWLNDTQLKIGFKWGCQQRDSVDIYLLDMTTLQASKIGELE